MPPICLRYEQHNEPCIYRISTVYVPCMYRVCTVVVGVRAEDFSGIYAMLQHFAICLLLLLQVADKADCLPAAGIVVVVRVCPVRVEVESSRTAHVVRRSRPIVPVVLYVAHT